MAPRQGRHTEGDRRRARRALVALAGAAALALAVFLAAWGPWGKAPPGEGAEHRHLEAPHGGALASLGVNDPHDHAEALLGPGGALTVYTLRPDARSPRAVGRQVLTAWLRAGRDARPARVALVPMPLPDDPPGTTSRFRGRLAEALWGRDLRVTVAELAVDGGRYRLEFAEVRSPGRPAEHEAVLRRLHLTPGGKYTLADVGANGGTTPAKKFSGHEADHGAAHDLAPERPGWLCPVTAARSEPGLAWLVGGHSYRFCCSPCIDEFVRLAKEEPGRVRPPEAYAKR